MSDPAAALRRGLLRAPAGGLGVAVSGGGDSLALLILMADWARDAGRAIAAVTVDHGLRRDSAAEAAAVAAIAAARGIPHAVLGWDGAGDRGNLQARARDARRRLIVAWAQDRGLAAVALGHTRDDQAETLLMRLARGSGVDGLAAMAPVSRAEGVVWLRPLLEVGRAALRDVLRSRGVDWVEDPTNADPDFLRVRARAALPHLAALGLGPERLAATAASMGRARAALEAATAELARAALVAGAAGEAVLDPAPLAAAPEEIRLRLVAGALNWVSGARYRPRLAHLLPVCAALAENRIGRGLTLHGCVLRPLGERVAILREPARAAGPVAAARRRWDGRWELIEGPTERLCIGALGPEGLKRRGRWRESGHPREALLSAPALWRDDDLVAAPVLDGPGVAAFRRISPLPAPWYPEVSR